MKTLFYGLSLGLVMLPGAALPDDAIIFGIYEECAPVASTVFVRSDQPDPARTDDIAAQAEAAGTGLVFDQALPVMISSLEKNGIRNIEIQRQGDCNTRQPSKYVEAVMDYCDHSLVDAKVYVDGRVLFHQTGTRLTLGDFMREARQKLEAESIFGDPRISLNNRTDCQDQTDSG